MSQWVSITIDITWFINKIDFHVYLWMIPRESFSLKHRNIQSSSKCMLEYRRKIPYTTYNSKWYNGTQISSQVFTSHSNFVTAWYQTKPREMFDNYSNELIPLVIVRPWWYQMLRYVYSFGKTSRPVWVRAVAGLVNVSKVPYRFF